MVSHEEERGNCVYEQFSPKRPSPIGCGRLQGLPLQTSEQAQIDLVQPRCDE